jgi:outer membrane autotransporter protein
MVADGQPAGPNYTEETTSSGLTVLATDTLDGVTSPTPAVPVTFTITSGTATFTSGGTAAGPINTLADGRASSPPIQVQRGSTNVVVEASATGRPTVIFSIAVTASTYVLSAERTPVSQQITRSGSASLAVQLQRSGSSVQPLQNASIDWTVSPADGSSLDPSVAITDALGVGSTLFRPAAAGRYTVTASFNTGGAGKTTVSQAFTIDVVDDQRRLDAVSGDGQSGEPGSNLSEPLVVQALENGQPAAGARIEWSGSGGVLLRGAQGVPNSVITELTGTDGRSSVDVTLPPAPGSFVITATWMQHTRNKTSAPVGLSVSFTVSAGAPATPSLEIVDGNDQRGVVGTPGSPLSARLLLNGRPASGFAVGWEVIEGDASISPSASTADAQGLVTTSLQFGAQTGQSTIRVASGLGVEAFFTVTAIAPPTIRISSGDGQRGAPNVALAGDLIVQVTTQTGQPVPGLAVGWSALEGDGSLAFATTTTDANGLASNRLTLGPQLGNNIIAATLANGSQVVFSATAVNGDGTGDVRLMREGGDGQRGLVGTRLPVPLSAKLLEGGQPVPQARIFWEVLSGSARVDASETLTNDNGVARVAVILGANAEPVQIRASASAAPDPVLFNLSAVNPEVAGQEGSGQAGTVGQPLPMDIAVNLVLPAGKTLAGVPVQWRVLTGGGALTAQQSLSDANGRASNQWTLGSEVGVQSAIATLPGGEELVFTANANPEQVVGSLAVVSGSPQSLPPNVPSQPLVVELRDQNGEPLAGVGIEWSGSEQRVALRDSITTTGQDGRASNVATVLVPGPASVSARVVGGDIAAVNFDLNGGVAEIPGLSDEERDIGTVVDNACPALAALPNRTPEQQDLFQRCSEFVGNAGEHPDEVRNALGQLPTDIGPTLSGQANESVGTQMDNLDLRLHMIRGEKTGAQRNQFNLSLWTPDGALPLSFLPSAFMAAAASDEDQAGLDFDRWGFFATGQIGRGQVDAGARSPEFDYDIAGLTFGADYRFNDRLVAGLALGYSDNDAELAGSRGDVATKGWTLSGYATWYSTTAWYVDGTLLLGRLDYDLRRRLSYSITGLDGGRTIVDQVASASTDGDLLGASISIGRDWQKGPWNVNGYFRGQYARVKTDAFVERMIEGLPGQGLALAVDSRSTESMTSAFGVRATYVLSRDWGILMPNASIEWEHEFEDDPGRLTARLAFDPTATPIERFGDALDSDYFNLGIGLSALFPGGRSAYLFYEELVGASRIRQGLLSLGVRLEF